MKTEATANITEQIVPQAVELIKFDLPQLFC